MTWREIAVPQFNTLKNVLLLDVRSPSEHEAERIPGSINIPLLSNDERAVVGTIYKEQGEMIARRHALGIISPKIPHLIDEIVGMRKHGQTVVVYCWRGGLRSESVASVLSIAGIDCYRLTGGYKAWRNQVTGDFAADAYPFEGVVLVGLTGTGKTEILNGLSERGLPVLDLEALANHRGSVFGGLGLGDQPSQKNFDAALWQKLRTLSNQTVVLEGESRKVGRIALPDCVFSRITHGAHILVTGSVEKRAQRIADDYLHPSRNPEKEMGRGLELLTHLKERLGGKAVEALQQLVLSGDVLEAVKILLVDYYDPLYNRQIERCRPFVLEVDGDDPEGAINSISAWLAARTEKVVQQR